MARASQEWPQQHSGQNAAQGTGRLPRQYDRPMHGIVRNNTGRMGRLMLGLGVANRRDNGCATPKGFLRRDSPCGGASSAKTCPFVGSGRCWPAAAVLHDLSVSRAETGRYRQKCAENALKSLRCCHHRGCSQLCPLNTHHQQVQSIGGF